MEGLELRLSRREWLKLTAAGAAASSCRASAPPQVAGGFVEPRIDLGHRLREGFAPRPVRYVDTDVAIVGAGMAGLSAAWTLQHAGVEDFVVIELDDRPGGTARSGRSAASAYPWGAHYVPAPPAANLPLVALLEEVGAIEGRDAAGRPVYAENVLCREPQERLHFNGEWYEGLFPYAGTSAEDERQLAQFEETVASWAAWRDRRGRRAFDVPRCRGTDDAEVRALDAISMDDFLAQRSWDSPRLRWLVEYATRDDFGALLSQTSAWAGLHYFSARQRNDEGASGEFLTWPEGNGKLVDHLAGMAGARLRTRGLVTSVRPESRGVAVTYFDWGAEEAVGVRARHCVFALPRFLAPRLIEGLPDVTAAAARQSVYGAWLVANLQLRDRPRERGAEIAWDNVLYDSPSLGYVVATHQSGPDHGPTVWTYYLPLTSDDPRLDRERLLAGSWEQWTGVILDDLSRAHADLPGLVERVDICRWGHAMVRPRPEYMWSEALETSRAALGRIHFAHTDLSGMALLEEAQYWGVHAAEAILRDAGQRHDSWLV